MVACWYKYNIFPLFPYNSHPPPFPFPFFLYSSLPYNSLYFFPILSSPYTHFLVFPFLLTPPYVFSLIPFPFPFLRLSLFSLFSASLSSSLLPKLLHPIFPFSISLSPPYVSFLFFSLIHPKVQCLRTSRVSLWFVVQRNGGEHLSAGTLRQHDYVLVTRGRCALNIYSIDDALGPGLWSKPVVPSSTQLL